MSKAFTLVEMLVVISVLAIATALAMPNLLNGQQSAGVAAFEYKLKSEVSLASTDAVRRQIPLTLSYDGTQFQIAPLDDNIAIIQSPSATQPGDENGTNPISTLAVPAGVTVNSFQFQGETVTASDWQQTFYRDGRTTDGSIELDENGKKRTLDIYPDGRTIWRDGLAVERASTTWPAGDLLQRAG